MSWGAPPPGGYGAPPPGYPGPPTGHPGPEAPRSARAERALRALRALPPPPEPAPGMGATPAFAPPVPRPNRTVLIVTLVLSATILICCGGSLTGVGGFFYYAYSTVQNDARNAVGDYLGDLRNQNYAAAYARVCPEAQSRQPSSAFADVQRRAGQVTVYRVNSDIEVADNGDWIVTADVTRVGRPSHTESFPVAFDDQNKARVCPR